MGAPLGPKYIPYTYMDPLVMMMMMMMMIALQVHYCRELRHFPFLDKDWDPGQAAVRRPVQS